MKISVYNQKGEEAEKTELPDEIFKIAFNPDLVHQVMVSQQSNKRQGTAHAKTRADVSGGGKKPWRQKGTGRARHGSTRSPIWKGGGVCFGPTKEKIYKKRIPRKIRRKALFMVLSAKANSELLFVLDKLELEQIKTKQAFEILKNLRIKVKGLEKGNILIALPKPNNNIISSFRNIPKIQTIQAKDLNVLDLLTYKYLMIPKETIEVIETTFLESAKGKAQSSKQQFKA